MDAGAPVVNGNILKPHIPVRYMYIAVVIWLSGVLAIQAYSLSFYFNIILAKRFSFYHQPINLQSNILPVSNPLVS